MQNTQLPDPQIIADFKQRRSRQFIAAVPAVLAIIAIFMLENAGPDGLMGIPESTVAPVCIAVIIGVVIFSFFNWRCPSCNCYLGRGMGPQFCQKCGVQLKA